MLATRSQGHLGRSAHSINVVSAHEPHRWQSKNLLSFAESIWMNPYWPFENRFTQWCSENRPLELETELRLRRDALEVVLTAILAGEITSLDGVDTALSKKISAHHGLAQFEMNSNWICTSQEWVCPCCSRSKFQVSRVGIKGQILAK